MGVVKGVAYNSVQSRVIGVAWRTNDKGKNGGEPICRLQCDADKIRARHQRQNITEKGEKGETERNVYKGIALLVVVLGIKDIVQREREREGRR